MIRRSLLIAAPLLLLVACQVKTKNPADDDDNVSIGRGGTSGKLLNASYKRTSRVNDLRSFLLQLALNLRRYAMCPDHRCFVAADLDRLVDGRDAFADKALHFLFVMDKRSEGADLIALLQGILDHVDGPLDTKTKPVFVG